MKKQKWIWEYEEYPNFKYDKDRLSLTFGAVFTNGKLVPNRVKLVNILHTGC